MILGHPDIELEHGDYQILHPAEGDYNIRDVTPLIKGKGIILTRQGTAIGYINGYTSIIRVGE